MTYRPAAGVPVAGTAPSRRDRRVLRDGSMGEVVTGVVVSSVGYYAAFVAAVWVFQVRRGGPRVRALFVRWAVGWLVYSVAVTGGAASGFAVRTSAGVFWQGAWAGASAVLWAGAVVGLAWLVRVGRRTMSAARVADAAGRGRGYETVDPGRPPGAPAGSRSGPSIKRTGPAASTGRT